MKIDVENAAIQTLLFSLVFFAFLFSTAKKSDKQTFFDPSQSNEIKGFAMLGIVFSHIGYFLSNNTQFLFPLSVLAGVGVNLFLFISGFGLTISHLRNPLSIWEFYRKRLLRLFIPMWIVLSLYLLLDYFLLNRSYPLNILGYHFLGFFPRADLFMDVNSPLWYFSLILFMYVIFPLFFWRKNPVISAVAILAVTYLAVTRFEIPVVEDVLKLYKLHIVAFPLGMLFALSLNEEHGQIFHNLRTFLRTRFHSFRPLKPIVISFLKLLTVFVFIYTAYHSGIEEGIRTEQTISLITMICIILIFLFKNLSFPIFETFGKYSYEIYLIHWPLLSRYDLLYDNFEPFLATLLYLGLFLGISMVLDLVVKKINGLIRI